MSKHPQPLATSKKAAAQGTPAITTPGRLWGSLIGLCVLIGVVIWKAARYWEFNFDDAFISFRYAQNIASGAGFYWNTSDPAPVEGTTTFLWTALLALFGVFGLDVWVVGKVLCALSLALVVVLMWWFANPRGRPLLSLLAPAALLSHPSINAHVSSGMETMFFTLVLMVLAGVTLQHGGTRGMTRWFCVLTVLAFMTRPESIVFSTVLAVGLFLRDNNKAGFVKDALTFGLTPALCFVVGKYLYFGQWVPNSYFVKQGHLSDLLGFGYVHFFFVNSMLGGVLLVAAAMAFGVAKQMRGHALLLVAALCQAAYFSTVYVAAGQGARFLIPIFPVFLLVVTAHLEPVFDLFSRPKRNHGAAQRVAAGVLIALLFLSLNVLGRSREMNSLYRYFGDRVINVEMGKMLAGVGHDPEEVTIATGEAGAIPFLTGYRHIDLLGLNNNRIGHAGFDHNYVFDQNPDVIVLHLIRFTEKNGKYVPTPDTIKNMRRDPLNDAWVGARMLQSERFGNFRLLGQVRCMGTPDIYFVFGNLRSEFFEHFAQKVREANFAPAYNDFREKYRGG